MRKLKNKVILNPAQLLAAKMPHKVKMLIWGRGTGKSTFLAWILIQLVKNLPRATSVLVGNTYMQILSNTLKSTKKGLELFGFYEGIDYLVGSSAGKKMGFQMPYEKPDKWDNIIHWANGHITQLIALDSPNSGRGVNSSAIVSDETALQDKDKLGVNVKNTNRTVPQGIIYKNNPYLFSETYVTSMPVTQKGKWVLEYEELCRKKPKEIFYMEANAKCNLENVRPDYFEYMKQSYLGNDFLYNAEMLNILPKEVLDGFYPQLNPDVHYYTDFDNGFLETIPLTNYQGQNFNCKADRDLNKKMPLIISVDWGASINTMSVHQNQGDVYRILKSFHVKTPKILDHLFTEEFIPYYEPFPNKVIHFYYDRMGNASTANSKLTFAEQAAEILRAAGWTVYLMTEGVNPSYIDKFRLFNVMLKEDGRGRLPKIRINEANNPNLIVSLERAELRETSKGIEKDKRPERLKSADQAHTTHYSDTFDYPIFTLFWEVFKNNGTSEFWDPMNL